MSLCIIKYSVLKKWAKPIFGENVFEQKKSLTLFYLLHKRWKKWFGHSTLLKEVWRSLAEQRQWDASCNLLPSLTSVWWKFAPYSSCFLTVRPFTIKHKSVHHKRNSNEINHFSSHNNFNLHACFFWFFFGTSPSFLIRNQI